MNRKKLNASACAEIAALETKILEYEHKKAICMEQEQNLRSLENPDKNIFFPFEIFQRTLERLQIEVKIDIYRKKIRRRKLDFDDASIVDCNGIF